MPPSLGTNRPRSRSPDEAPRADVVRSVSRAMSMLLPAHMSEVRRFVLARDVFVDLGMLTDRTKLAAAHMLSGRRTVWSGPERVCIDLDVLLVPVANVGFYNVGLFYGTVGNKTVGDADEDGGGRSDGEGHNNNMVRRVGELVHTGRFCRDERTGEICTVQVVVDLRSPKLATVAILWCGPAGADRRAREAMDFTCDADLFFAGRMVESVQKYEHTVHVSARDSPLPIIPRTSSDFSSVANNMAFYSGESRDYTVVKGGGGEITLYGNVAVASGEPLFVSSLKVENQSCEAVQALRLSILHAVTRVKMSAMEPAVLRWPFCRLFWAAVHSDLAKIEVLREGGEAEPRIPDNDFNPGGCLYDEPEESEAGPRGSGRRRFGGEAAEWPADEVIVQEVDSDMGDEAE